MVVQASQAIAFGQPTIAMAITSGPVQQVGQRQCHQQQQQHPQTQQPLAALGITGFQRGDVLVFFQQGNLLILEAAVKLHLQKCQLAEFGFFLHFLGGLIGQLQRLQGLRPIPALLGDQTLLAACAFQ